MSSPPSFCNACATIVGTSRGERYENENRVELGTLPQVRSRACGLCKLVGEALDRFRRAEPFRQSDPFHLTFRSPAEDIIRLSLTASSAPGYRSGLMVIRGSPLEGYWPVKGLGIAFSSLDPQITTKANRVKKYMLDSVYLRSRLDPVLDFKRVRGWLDHCTRAHGRGCWSSAEGPITTMFPGLDILRLVDVVGGHIFETRQDVPQYVALSYVWGAGHHFRLTTAARPQLVLPGGLKKIQPFLPRTISDAVTLVRELGMRYLWVDSLCLLQNDADDVERGVRVMNRVYGHAWLTIVAASGHDANAGLPGVQIGSRDEHSLAREIYPGISAVRIDRSFQEYTMSRRVLCFVGNEVSFQCQKFECMEIFEDVENPRKNLWLKTTDPSWALARNDLLAGYEQYAWALRNYTSRSLTNQSDALRAISGTIQQFTEQLRCNMVEGLPAMELDRFIAFSGRHLRRRLGFASYSWAGWIGGVGVSLETNRSLWLQDQFWIVWYRIEPGALAATAAIEGESGTYHLHVGQGSSQFPWLDMDTSRYEPTRVPYPTRSALRYPLLQFWTMSSFFKFGNVDVFRQAATLIDSDGDPCGTIMLDGFEETKFFEGDKTFELLLISRTISVLPEDEASYSMGGLPGTDCYRVMLVEEVGSFVERRGIGGVKKSAIRRSFPPGPVWREILLG
ncbi:hypothetical protein OQA88_5442 [Cercophora sp. LCS_1]